MTPPIPLRIIYLDSALATEAVARIRIPTMPGSHLLQVAGAI